MTAQLQLDISTPKPKPEATPEQVDELCARLAGQGWQYARALRDQYGYDDREVRSIAAASDGRIISGQKGYRLFDGQTSCEDALRAAAWLSSQAKEMQTRATAILRRYHQYNHNPKPQ